MIILLKLAISKKDVLFQEVLQIWDRIASLYGVKILSSEVSSQNNTNIKEIAKSFYNLSALSFNI